jgi:hypothetical protein
MHIPSNDTGTIMQEETTDTLMVWLTMAEIEEYLDGRGVAG